MTRSLTGRPQPRSSSYQPDWVSGTAAGTPATSGPGMPLPPVSSPGTASPCTIRPSGRVAVTRGSFCRSDPAAELRGFANGALPASVSRSFSSWNAVTGRNTSPLTSRVSGQPVPASRVGTAAIVLTFGVTSSPVTPSPRVAARTSRPPRYTRAIASPSIFSSHRYGPTVSSDAAAPSRSARAAQPSSSSAENALSRLSSRSRCCTGVKSVEIAPPTFWVGDSGVRSSGYCSSSSRSSRISRSYSASETSGESSTW